MRVRWGISASDITNFDRESQPKVYAGPLPPANQVYRFRLTIFRYVPAVEDKNPQLRVGLELVPHIAEHKKYKGYFIQSFEPVTPQTNWRYVKYLDALGIGARAFVEGPHTIDDDGNLKRIGRWQMRNQYLMVQLRTSDSEDYPRSVGAVQAYEEDTSPDPDDEYQSQGDEWDDDDTDAEEPEEEQRPRRRPRDPQTRKPVKRMRATRARRADYADDDDDSEF